MNRKQGIGMFTHRCYLPQRIECGKEKTHHRNTPRSTLNRMRRETNLKVRIGVPCVYNKAWYDSRFFRAGSLNLTCALCLWKLNDFVVVGARNVFLSSLTHSYSCVHTTKAFPCSSFPLISLCRAIVVERARDFWGPASTRMRNFYGSGFLVMKSVAVCEWRRRFKRHNCLTLAHWHPERIHSLAAALLLLIVDKILIGLYCLFRAAVSSAIPMSSPMCTCRAFNSRLWPSLSPSKCIEQTLSVPPLCIREFRALGNGCSCFHV